MFKNFNFGVAVQIYMAVMSLISTYKSGTPTTQEFKFTIDGKRYDFDVTIKGDDGGSFVDQPAHTLVTPGVPADPSGLAL